MPRVTEKPQFSIRVGSSDEEVNLTEWRFVEKCRERISDWAGPDGGWPCLHRMFSNCRECFCAAVRASGIDLRWDLMVQLRVQRTAT